MLPVIEKFTAAHRLPDATVVADAGMISEANQQADLEVRARTLAGIKGYVTNLAACSDGTRGPTSRSSSQPCPLFRSACNLAPGSGPYKNFRPDSPGSKPASYC